MPLLFQPGFFFVFVKLLKRIGPYAVTLCKSKRLIRAASFHFHRELHAICFCNAGFKHPFLPNEFILNSGYTAGEGLIILT